MRNHIQDDKALQLESGGYTAHDCATVFKGYLADLSEPLLTDAHYPAHLQIAPLCVAVNAYLKRLNDLNRSKIESNLMENKNFNENGDGNQKYSRDEEIQSTTISTLQPKQKKSINNNTLTKRESHVLNAIQLLLLLLPDGNRELLQHVMEMLNAVALRQQNNKMGPENLATLFTPHLICPRNLPPEVLHYVAKSLSSIISYMIIRSQEIFQVPAKLATDIRAYLVENKRKRTMSPELTLDESMSDVSTINTVYTFVDREKTAAAQNANVTDTELAQLYAYIQSLPESSKKRRLIKQFNKQNGQGLQIYIEFI